MANAGCELDTSGKTEPHLKNCLPQIGRRACLQIMLLVASGCRRTLSTVSGTVLGKWVV